MSSIHGRLDILLSFLPSYFYSLRSISSKPETTTVRERVSDIKRRAGNLKVARHPMTLAQRRLGAASVAWNRWDSTDANESWRKIHVKMGNYCPISLP
jgi:hypothetical protein